jgi:hypothetical protein
MLASFSFWPALTAYKFMPNTFGVPSWFRLLIPLMMAWTFRLS